MCALPSVRQSLKEKSTVWPRSTETLSLAVSYHGSACCLGGLSLVRLIAAQAFSGRTNNSSKTVRCNGSSDTGENGAHDKRNHQGTTTHGAPRACTCSLSRGTHWLRYGKGGEPLCFQNGRLRGAAVLKPSRGSFALKTKYDCGLGNGLARIPLQDDDAAYTLLVDCESKVPCSRKRCLTRRKRTRRTYTSPLR